MNQEIITTKKKKKWYKRKLFYLTVIAAVVLGGVAYGQYRKTTAESTYETVRVERGALMQTVDATGNVQSANELDLRFEVGGRIGNIFKQTGESVLAGDALVDLQLNELNAAVAQASANVQKAQADLNKVLAGDTPEFIASLEARLAKARADLEQIRVSSADSVSDAEAALKTAENNLKLSEGGDGSQIVQDAYDDMVTLLNAVQNTLADALIEADNILGIDNTFANDEFEDELANRDETVLASANTKYRAAKAAKIDVDEALNALSVASPHDQIDWAADTAEEGLFVMRDLLFLVADVLEKTNPVGDLSVSELDALKTGVQSARGSVSSDYASLVNQQQAIDSAKNSYITNKIAFDKAVADLENTKKKADADIAAYEALVDQARANLDDAKNPPREVDVASFRAGLSAARASLAKAVANRNKARIIAPLDGMIGKIKGRVGEYVGATDVVVKLVSPRFEIKVDIPETDIVKISSEDSATIKLDAFGDDVEFVGRVMEIEEGETIIQDVVYYTVTLSLEDSEEYQILNGMTADVLFFTEEKKNALFVPQRTVRSDKRGKYVRILTNGEVVEVVVRTGLRGDGGLIEIVEGLREGQEVVLSVSNGE